MNPTTDPNQLASQAQNYYNDPSLAQANTQATNTAQAAGTSQAMDATLPNMLQQALASKVVNENDPNTQNTGADLTKYLTDLGNPEAIADSASNGVILNPTQRRDIIAGRLGAESGRVALDNLIAGARYGGLSNFISTVASIHSAQTQQLINQAQVQKDNYDRLLNTISQKSSVAMSAANLAAQMKQYQLSAAEFGVSSDLNRPLVLAAMQADAAAGKTWEDMLKKYGNNPYINTQEILNTYNQANYYKRPADVTTQQKNSFNLNLGTGTIPQGIQSLTGQGGNNSSASGNDPLGIR